MRIGVDCRVIGSQMHGIARHCLNLVRAFVELDDVNSYVLLVSRACPRELLPVGHQVTIQQCDLPLYGVREQLRLPVLLRRMKLDLFHSPTFTAPVLQVCPTIMTIHDLIHILFPEDYTLYHRFYYQIVVRAVAQRAARVLTVSEASRRDIIRLLQVEGDRIVCISNGVESGFHPASQPDATRKALREKWAIDGSFIFWAGNPRPHKNLLGALQVFQEVRRDYPRRLSLVVHGVSEDEAFRIAGCLAPLDGVLFINRLADEDLVELYSLAELFLSLSHYEGFCLPVLEAMACGAPIVASNIPAIAETTAGAALLVDPCDTPLVAKTIRMVLEDRELQTEMRKKGRERSRMFTWRRVAERVLALHGEIMTGALR